MKEPRSKFIARQLWFAYQTGQSNADSTDKRVFVAVVGAEIESMHTQLTEVTRQKEDLEAREKDLENLLNNGVDLITHCDIGTCMCGGSMKNHSMIDNHPPTSMFDHYAGIWMDEAKTLLSLPITGSAERIRQEARKEAFREVDFLNKSNFTSLEASILRASLMKACPEAFKDTP